MPSHGLPNLMGTTSANTAGIKSNTNSDNFSNPIILISGSSENGPGKNWNKFSTFVPKILSNYEFR